MSSQDPPARRVRAAAAAVARGAGLGAVAGAGYGVLLAVCVLTAGLLVEDTPSGGVDVAAWLTLVTLASAIAVVVGTPLGALAGAGLGLVLWLAVGPLSRALRRRSTSTTRGARWLEPAVAGVLAAVYGLLLLPRRLVDNTTMLLEGGVDDALQLAVGKLVPTVLLVVLAVRLWPWVTGCPRPGAQATPPP